MVADHLLDLPACLVELYQAVFQSFRFLLQDFLCYLSLFSGEDEASDLEAAFLAILLSNLRRIECQLHRVGNQQIGAGPIDRPNNDFLLLVVPSQLFMIGMRM